jgi:inhibitor of KinA sporulation pathway (predicted exonuclease)
MKLQHKIIGYQLTYRDYKYKKADTKLDKARKQLNKAENTYGKVIGGAIKQALEDANKAHKLRKGN